MNERLQKLHIHIKMGFNLYGEKIFQKILKLLKRFFVFSQQASK